MHDLGGGGAERVTVNLANALALRDHTVEIVLMSTAQGVFIADLRPEVRVVDLSVTRMRGLLIPLIRYLQRSQPDTLLACMWPLTVIAPWAQILARARTRIIVAEHTTWSRAEIVASRLRRWQVRITMRLTFPWVDGVIAVSKGAADDLANFAGLDRSAITVIYNPVVGVAKAPSSTPLVPEGWWSGAHRRVLAVGTLKAIKDYATLMKAFAKLRQNVDARLLILGEGECRAALEAQVRQLGIETSVFLPGFVSDPSPYYQHGELLVLSSIGEGLPTVIIEALEAGMPVVSTDCPSGPREILSDGQFGHLAPVGDTEALAEAMAESLARSQDKAALKERAQDFSINEAVNHYERLLLGR